MKKKVALVGGTFDPITKGHESLVKRALELFDTVYISICLNSEKKCMFTDEERYEMLCAAFSDKENVIPVIYNGLISDLAKEKEAVIVKGLRFSSDFDYEHLQAESNYLINGTETVFLSSHSEDMFVTSSLVRELIKNKKPVDDYVSDAVLKKIKKYSK
jgi:pantetheine-phosphate adenylyltransferase